MKTFKQFFTEVLSVSQIKSLKNWTRDYGVGQLTDHYFGKGNDEIVEPFTQKTKSDVHKQIEDHLGHEISIPEYRTGMINGQRLKSRLPEKLIRAYNSDQSKNIRYNPEYNIRVTRSKDGVAGQTSSGQSWENSSCKNFESGSHREVLKKEYSRGVVVSYLRDKNGKELARSTFSPFKNDNGETIYKLTATYGRNVPTGFLSHSKDLEKKLSLPHNDPLSLYHADNELALPERSDDTALHPHVSDDKQLLSKALTNKIQNGEVGSDDFDTGKYFGFAEPKHYDHFSAKLLSDLKSGNYNPYHIQLAKTLGVFNKDHENELHSALLKKINNTNDSFGDDIPHIDHAISNGYMSPDHVNAAVNKVVSHFNNDNFDTILDPVEYISKLHKSGFMTKQHHKLIDDAQDEFESRNESGWEPEDTPTAPISKDHEEILKAAADRERKLSNISYANDLPKW